MRTFTQCGIQCGMFVVLVVALACGKQLNPEFCAAHPGDERCEAITPDASPIDAPEIDHVAHLDSAAEAMLTGTGTWVIDEPTMINTTDGSISSAVPGAVKRLPSVAQEVGPNVMVIQATSIRIEAPLTVIGDKPLVLVATADIAINDDIDAAANSGTRGPGGGLPAAGAGKGAGGANGDGDSDSGGAGASFGSIGSRGGSANIAIGPMPGPIYGTSATLEGGSGGGAGAGNGCSPGGGAGGGAIQLSARVSITLGTDDSIDVGGGGGQRGLGTTGSPSCNNDGASGAGGGSGGMIFLQAPMLLGDGTLVANGGGGGGSASTGGGTLGDDGDDGSITGGGEGGSGSASGGPGASDGSAAGPGQDNQNQDGNAGGGGGGMGRIYYLTAGPRPGYATSPEPEDA